MDNDFLEDFAQMALDLHGEESVHETVDRVLQYALKAVHCGYAGVVFVHNGQRIETAAATDSLVADLEAIQVECGEGPDIDVLADRYSVIVGDTRTETRWPRWAHAVSQAGIRSLLSVRMYTSSSTVGTLNLYDEQPNRFDVADQEVAHVLARHAAVALASAREEEHLWQAIDSRKRIGQAQGILMERYNIDEERAFAVLMRYSQSRNMKLRAVAEKLVSTRDLPH
ncbi:GAF and ANTAR domain-containing protein [Nocardioides terrisoli]|uniref:GAF and ANTAR domain-containing protein n=1 Tax=Nocardioides terrisoli TaxID=3388267 RepID=UPI00287BA31E|nr:GAF and ANTAR domain-containing protein [Nocardioides marmorisolisilvae]